MQCAQRKTAPLSASPLSPTDAPKKNGTAKKNRSRDRHETEKENRCLLAIQKNELWDEVKPETSGNELFVFVTRPTRANSELPVRIRFLPIYQ
jgi:hypothetical protein